MKKKYLVTGGTGFIGSALVRRLIKEGYGVRVFDNDLRGVQSRLFDIAGKIEMVKGDIRNPRTVANACRGVDGVIHLAYLNGTEYFYKFPELVLDIGVKGMVNVIDGCIKHGVRELVLASSSEVYQLPPKIPTDEGAPLTIPDVLNPRYSYGGGKIISEIMAINYGRKHFDRVLIFRPHNVYGPDMGFEHVIPQLMMRMKSLLQGKLAKFPIQGTGNETRSFIFIDDFIDGLMAVIKKGKHLNIYHIGTMDEVTISDLVKKISLCMHKDVRIVPGTLAKGSVQRRCPDISRLQSIGFNPKTSLNEGLNKTAQWYCNHDKPKKSL